MPTCLIRRIFSRGKEGITLNFPPPASVRGVNRNVVNVIHSLIDIAKQIWRLAFRVFSWLPQKPSSSAQQLRINSSRWSCAEKLGGCERQVMPDGFKATSERARMPMVAKGDA